MFLALVLVIIVAISLLAYHRTPIWLWAAVALAIGMISLLLTGSTGAFSWIVAMTPAVLLGLASIPLIRRPVLTAPLFRAVNRILPRISSTEQEALDAGTVGWDADLFSGRPNWDNLLNIGDGSISEEERDFLDGPTEELCLMIDDWDIRHNLADLPPDVWKFLKDKGFLGMLISKEHGGLGFSAQAQSQIVSKIASRSVSVGITVMVPNSLGPGELLEKYGTPEQQKKYLARLAQGKEVPCFALTGPTAGSDAAGMPDIGVVTHGDYKGEKVLGVRVSWDKRYITLAPVATLLGLAFNLVDPENLLGKGEKIGITLALVPAKYPGVKIGRRHYPSRSAFMNGPTQGTEVFIPMEFLIGGPNFAGQGWRMLMDCLSTGRAISLPAIGSVSMKATLRVTSAYARIRRQFGIPVGMMEGVAEPMARLVKSAYMFEGARAVTATMVDEGQKPAVISALLKYRSTEAMRDRTNDAMDIHGGRAIQDGPSNYLFSGYANIPVAITVEGANILTRTLITFAQGALRAHPYLYDEITAAQNPDKAAGLKDFDKAFAGHLSFVLGNVTGSFWQSITLGRFASSPVEHELAHWYRQLHRYSQNFALVGDWTVAFLGGDLKRKQRLSGRMADILSDLYLLSTTLKRYEDDGRIKDDIPVIEAIARDRVAAIELNFRGVFDNFPNVFLSSLMRFLVFPIGQHNTGSTDRENYRIARAILNPSEQRDRFTGGIHLSFDPNDRTGVLEDALIKVTRAAESETKFVRALKKGLIEVRLDRDAITDAVTAEILTNEEAGFLRLADEATQKVIAVDDFAPDELGAINRLSNSAAFSEDAKPKSRGVTKTKSGGVTKAKSGNITKAKRA